jgi:glycosyltransferase involved in cell wall biosynthesis
METVLIHQAFASQDEPGGTRHYELGRRLVESGHGFTVIASDVSYQTGRRIVSQIRLVTVKNEDGIRLLRTYTYSALHKSYLSRVLSFLSFMVTSVLVGIRSGKPDLIMGTTPPIFQAVSAWLLAKIKRRPFLLEVRDLWPEFAIDIGLLTNPALIRIARWLEGFLYGRADHILVNSPAYREYIVRKGIDERKVSLIPNGVDPAMFIPDDRGDSFRRRFNLLDKFVVTYAGAIGMANDLDTLIQAAYSLRNNSRIHILIAGDGKERKRLEQEAGNRNLTNITFAGSFPKRKIAEVLAASDACVAILRNIPMFTTTYPNKVFDYMAAGRPTILAIDGVIRDVIEAADGGIFTPPGDAQALAVAIENLASDPQTARRMGHNARAFVEQHFHRDVHAAQLAQLLQRVAARDPA